jgi:hypothetical protein
MLFHSVFGSTMEKNVYMEQTVKQCIAAKAKMASTIQERFDQTIPPFPFLSIPTERHR